MTEPTKPLPSSKPTHDLIMLAKSILADNDHERIIKSLKKHRDALVRQYNDPTHYYGPMLPSEMAVLRDDLAYDYAAMVMAVGLLFEMQAKNAR